MLENCFQLARNFLSLFFARPGQLGGGMRQYNLELNNISDRLSHLGVVILTAGVVPSVLRVGGRHVRRVEPQGSHHVWIA